MTYAGSTGFLRGDEWRVEYRGGGEDGAPRELDEAGERRMRLAAEALQYGPMGKADLMRACGVGHWGTEAFLTVMTYQLPIWEDDKGRIGLIDDWTIQTIPPLPESVMWLLPGRIA